MIGSRRTAQVNTATVGQPRPSSNRLEPVIFAAAKAAKAESPPAFQAKMMSTAYSGRTANRATVIRARALGMSCSAASAPQDMANAAPTIPSPKRSVATSTGGAQAPSRSANAGTPATTTRMTANTLLMNDSRGADVTGWWSDDDAIHQDPPTSLRDWVWAGGLAGQA